MFIFPVFSTSLFEEEKRRKGERSGWSSATLVLLGVASSSRRLPPNIFPALSGDVRFEEAPHLRDCFDRGARFFGAHGCSFSLILNNTSTKPQASLCNFFYISSLFDSRSNIICALSCIEAIIDKKSGNCRLYLAATHFLRKLNHLPTPRPFLRSRIP